MKNTIFSLALTFAVSLFFSGIIHAQTQNADSLINVLNTQKLEPEERITIYKKLCAQFGHSDIKRLLEYSEKGLALAEKEKDKANASFFNETIGMYYESNLKMDTAAFYYKKALALALEIKDVERESGVYLSLGAFYFVQEQLTPALNYFMDALRASSNLEDKKNYILALGNVGAIHYNMKNNKKAGYYFEQALSTAKEKGSLRLEINPSYYLGLICREEKEFDKALKYTQNVLDISRKLHLKDSESVSLQSLAKIYFVKTLPDYEKALQYAEESLRCAEECGYIIDISGALITISNVYREQNRWKECEEAAFRAWENDSVTLIGLADNIQANIVLANIHLDNKEKAVVFFNKFYDSMLKYNDKNLHDSLMEMEVKYETEKKELRIAALEKEKTLYIWLSVAGGALLLSLLLLFILRHRLAKQRVKQLEQEKQIIAVQSVLEGETEERKRVAGELHDSLGAMLSVVKLNLDDVEHLQNARDLLDQSISELRRIAHRMMPESLLRYGLKVSLEDFCLSVPAVKFHYYGDDSRLDNKMELLIYRCVHELVNNSIKYSGADVINVQLVQDADRISLTVQDNGCGFDTEAPAHGMGLKNLRDRIAAYGGKITIYSEQGKGTEVYVECLASTLTLV
jgi:signal transduction histidine kinase